MEMSLFMNSVTLIYIWILVFPIGIIEVLTTRKWYFLLYFIPYTITDFQPPENLYNIPRVGIVAM
jgi:hypothetical protein